MSEMTARLELPLIRAGQAGKEIAHNEALTRLSMLVQPVVEAVGAIVPPPDALAGQAWILGAEPTGDWIGHPLAIAGFTEAGWRFTAPGDGLTAWVAPVRLTARFANGGWSIGDLHASRLFIDGSPSIGAPQPAIVDPAGGGNIDTESRSSVAAILEVLRFHGLILA